MKSLVSVIIPTYNRAHLIGETLDSVLNQNYTNWECVVVDDDSTDDTRQVLRQYIDEDPRIRYVSRPSGMSKGASVCRNIGLSMCNGVYIQFLDSDDIISPEKISSQVTRLENEKKNSVVTCKWGRFKSELSDAEIYDGFSSYDDFERPEDFLNALPKSLNFFPVHAYLIKKEVINKAGYWNEYLHFNEDAEFMTRIIANSQKIAFSNTGVAFYRLPVDKNVSEYSDIEKVKDGLASWKLIELNLKIRFGERANSFINKGKGEFYLRLKDFPEILKKERLFFKDQIKSDTSQSGLLKRILKKMN